MTKQGFDFFHRVFDYPYPFDKYDQLFVPEFNAGAMENAGAVTFLEDYVFRSKVSRARYERRAETVLHELAHMWFGDLVTMRWWDDLWLNESFATYISTLCQAEATEYTTAWTTFANTEKAWAYAQDQLPSTHPIAADIPDVAAVEVNFDGITYAKGASVLKQLVAYVGRDEFLAGVRRYFRKHEYGNTTLADLLTPLSESSGRDLSEWVEQWLRSSQVNTLRPVYELTDDGRYRSFAIEQTAVAEHPVLRNHRLAVGLYSDGPDGLARTHRVELDVAGARTEVAELVGHPAADLVLVNDDDLTYAKLRLDERSLASLRTRIGTIPDPLARALCWSAAWDMTRDAELPAREWVQLVLSGVDAESEISVVQSLLARVQTALSSFADPSWAPEGWTALADHALASLEAAPAGSDMQLQWSRTFAGAARSREHAEVLRGLLDGTRTIEGLVVDADARWALLMGLVAIGAAGAAEIDAEAERDATATGARRAATARALLPTKESKAETWQRAFHDDAMPERRARGDAARLLAPGAAGAHRGLRGAVLRGHPAAVGPASGRDREERRPVPVPAGRRAADRRGRRRLAGRRRAAGAAAPAGARGPRRDRPRPPLPGVRRRCDLSAYRTTPRPRCASPVPRSHAPSSVACADLPGDRPGRTAGGGRRRCRRSGRRWRTSSSSRGRRARRRGRACAGRPPRR